MKQSDLMIINFEKRKIRNELPNILRMPDIFSLDEVCDFIGTKKKGYIIKHLFTILENELHNINNDNLDLIKRIIFYINCFSKLNIVSNIYLYRRTKMALYIINALKRYYKKRNVQICDILNHISRKLNIIKTESTVITKDHYKFLMKFIYEIKDIKDIKELIAKYPDFVNLKDNKNIHVLCNLIDTFIKALVNKKLSSSLYLLTYYQSVIEVFLKSESLVLPDNDKLMIENKLRDASNKLEISKEPQKMLWIKSLCHSLLGDKPLTTDEVIQKYNVYVYTPAEEKANYKINKDGRAIVEGKKIITIDGAYSEDLDDALNLEVRDNKYHLTGFISDVASSIRRGSRLDSIARRRSTTFYGPDRINPLFPFIISENLLSLKPGTLKNVIAYHLVLNKNGIVEDEMEIYPASVMIDRRLSYDEANKILLKGDSDYEIEKMLNEMSELTSTIRGNSNRYSMGYSDVLDLGTHFNNQKSNAHRIIEEFMILINSYTAQKFSNMLGVPYFYRVHSLERSDEINRIKAIIDGMYIEDYVKVNEIIKILQRIMDNAKYSLINTGHEALNVDYYSHVTSPIRRYADLIIQRIIHDFLFNEITLEKVKYYEQNLERWIREINEMNFVNKNLEKEYIRSKILTPKALKCDII